MKKKLNIRKAITRQFRADRKIGKAPGSVIYQGLKQDGKYSVEITRYNKEVFTHEVIENFNNGIPAAESDLVTWINVRGLSKEDEIEKLGKSLGLNALTLEDIVNTNQRPKLDEHESYIFFVLRMLYLDDDYNEVQEHVAIVLTESTVLLFQEAEKDVFDGVRERLKGEYGRIRQRGADYLFFALIDAIVDQYFLILENLYHKIEILEDRIYYRPNSNDSADIQKLKKEVLNVRKPIFPLKELIRRLHQTQHRLIEGETKLFIADTIDHTLQIHENLELYREMSVNLMEMYMSNMSNKMNEVMKVLTIMASIFIPLTFIAGIYGMNFQHMPELQYTYGYYWVLGVMALVIIIMLVYFKRKGWL